MRHKERFTEDLWKSPSFILKEPQGVSIHSLSQNNKNEVQNVMESHPTAKRKLEKPDIVNDGAKTGKKM